jgi:molecular chaperone IbpA
MRTYDFSPLGRSSIGFDRLFDIINNTKIADAQDNYPPYDIVRTGPDQFRIVLAVAGFSPDNLDITAQQNLLTVTGRNEETERDYLFRGISARPFERRFSLADHVEVAEAACDNGLLRIDLVRRLPEAMKPRSIAINAGPGAAARGVSKAA